MSGTKIAYAATRCAAQCKTTRYSFGPAGQHGYHPLSPCAADMRCPVLRYAPLGYYEDSVLKLNKVQVAAYAGATQCPDTESEDKTRDVEIDAKPPVTCPSGPRAQYAMRGTEIAYGACRYPPKPRLRRVQYCDSVWLGYAMSDTEIAYGAVSGAGGGCDACRAALHAHRVPAPYPPTSLYAMSGTDLRQGVYPPAVNQAGMWQQPGYHPHYSPTHPLRDAQYSRRPGYAGTG
eukprot:3169922-Rhodomonas_salina.4